MKHSIPLLVAILTANISFARTLQPGFDIAEYTECIRMASHFAAPVVDDSSYLTPKKPERFQRRYSSPVVGFDNLWELWESSDSTLAVSVRGSVVTAKSWMANFHAAMVPAQGEVVLGKTYNYNVCADTLASVHVGWLVAMLSLSEDIEHKLDSCYLAGFRNVILTGHSQGGAITFLLTSHLRLRQQQGKLPADLVFKTYCSAAPKPADYNFAVSYEHLTRGGWAYNVVNADDWVPEVPLSVQRIVDFRPTNPFTHLAELTADMGAVDRFKVKFLFRQLAGPLKKSEKRLRKYLGKTLGKMLADEAPDYTAPTFAQNANYARCGQTIILFPDANYHEVHPLEATDAFEHHMFKAYDELAEKY